MEYKTRYSIARSCSPIGTRIWGFMRTDENPDHSKGKSRSYNNRAILILTLYQSHGNNRAVYSIATTILIYQQNCYDTDTAQPPSQDSLEENSGSSSNRLWVRALLESGSGMRTPVNARWVHKGSRSPTKEWNPKDRQTHVKVLIAPHLDGELFANPNPDLGRFRDRICTHDPLALALLIEDSAETGVEGRKLDRRERKEAVVFNRSKWNLCAKWIVIRILTPVPVPGEIREPVWDHVKGYQADVDP